MKKWRTESIKCEILFSLMNPTHSGSSVALEVNDISAKHRTKIYKGFCNIVYCIYVNDAELLRYKGTFQLNTLTSVHWGMWPYNLNLGLSG